MTDVLIKLIENPRPALFVFIFLLLTQAGPAYSVYRIEQALIRLAERIECGQKIQISNLPGQNLALAPAPKGD